MSLFEEVNMIENARGYCSAASMDIARFGDDTLYRHSDRVYRMVAELWPDDHTAQVAALLHDLVEDTAVTLDMIKANFGEVVADTVDALTTREEETYDEYFRRLVRTKNISAIRVKFSDAIDNSDICIGLLDAENLSVASFIYYRIKYRITSGLLCKILKSAVGGDDNLEQAHRAVVYKWVMDYDIKAIQRLRDNKHIPLQPKGRILQTINAFVENTHWREDSQYVTPWHADVERRFLDEKDYPKKSSQVVWDSLYKALREDVRSGMYDLS